MRFTVDTQVLIYATTKVGRKTDPAHATMIRAAQKLLEPLSRIPVSAIVAAEYVPFAGNPTLWSRFEIIAFDAAQAFVAADLGQKLRAMPSLCPQCLNPKRQPKACGMCSTTRIGEAGNKIFAW